MVISCDVVNLTTVIGPKELDYLSINDHDESSYVQSSISNFHFVNGESSDNYYWYQYSLFTAGFSNLTIISDVISPNDLSEYNSNNKYIVFDDDVTNDDYRIGSSCSSLMNSNIFTCFGGNYGGYGLYCNIYDNINRKWLNKPILIESHEYETNGTDYTIQCFGDIFLVIWFNIDKPNDLSLIVTSKYYYSLFDANTFKAIITKQSIFNNELPMNVWLINSITVNNYDSNKLLFIFNDQSCYSYPDTCYNVYIYNTHYENNIINIDNYTMYISQTRYQNDRIFSVSNVMNYMFNNNELIWIIPLNYQSHTDFHLFDDSLYLLDNNLTINYPNCGPDYTCFVGYINIVSLNMLNNNNNNNNNNNYYFGLIYSWTHPWTFSGGSLILNVTAIKIDSNKEIHQLNTQTLLYEAHNKIAPNIQDICFDIIPKSDQLFISWWKKTNNNYPIGQTWTVELIHG